MALLYTRCYMTSLFKESYQNCVFGEKGKTRFFLIGLKNNRGVRNESKENKKLDK